MIDIEPIGGQHLRLTDSRLPESPVRLTVPEWISTRESLLPIGSEKPLWKRVTSQCLTGVTRSEDGSTLEARISAGEDTVSVRITLTNQSGNAWFEVSDFCCWSFMDSRNFMDFGMVRTYVWAGGECRRVIDLDRGQRARPLFMFYPVVEPGRFQRIEPLARNDATYPESLDHGAIAVVSYDRKWTCLVEGENTLFTFNNGEYSCIHSCPSYGTIEPWNTTVRTTRLLTFSGTPAEALERMRRIQQNSEDQDDG